MTGMVGRIADRFHEYHPGNSFQQRLEIARQVQGMDGIEVTYPTEFENISQSICLLRDSGIPISALNLNIKQAKVWENGSFTSPNVNVRRRAVSELKTALDLAAELGTAIVTCCPLIDGHNYHFEVDYLQQWGWLEEGIREGASHRTDIKLSLEYKLNESRNFNILSDMGRTLYLCERLGLPHVGITMDVGHALIAKEAPAEALCLAAQAGKLFYVHFNDNYRDWDWDMLPGAINFWDLVEMLYYLKSLDWEGWVSYDVVTRGGDLVESMESAISIVKSTEAIVEKFDPQSLARMIQDCNPARTYDQLFKLLL